MDVGEVLGIVISVGTGAITIAIAWGVVQTKVRHLEKANAELLKDVKASREAQGKRIGALELWRAYLEGRSSSSGKPRRPSRAIPVPTEGADDRDEGGDESGANT
jgi:hypothetical protein